MAKSTIIILASTLCFLSFLGSTYAQEHYLVEGNVYCDTCRVHFRTKLSEPIADATVRVECSQVDNSNNVTFNEEAMTDSSGLYQVEVQGDHEEQMCQVALVKSPREDCSEIDHDTNLQKAVRISMTRNNEVVSVVRQAIPLGFLKAERLPGCADLLQDLGLKEDGTHV
ncbi:Olee protein [Spatholobus suberectus]|nr:Olee protein [Spatholobus suberectus]